MRMMGIPETDLQLFLDWVHDILHLSVTEDPDRSRQLTAITNVMDYFRQLIAQRRAQPQEDLLSRATGWKIDGEAIPDSDLESFALLMFQAGLDTVPIQLGYTFHYLATHPQTQAALAADLSRAPAAVEETLRLYSFVVPSRKTMPVTPRSTVVRSRPETW